MSLYLCNLLLIFKDVYNQSLHALGCDKQIFHNWNIYILTRSFKRCCKICFSSIQSCCSCVCVYFTVKRLNWSLCWIPGFPLAFSADFQLIIEWIQADQSSLGTYLKSAARWFRVPALKICETFGFHIQTRRAVASKCWKNVVERCEYSLFLNFSYFCCAMTDSQLFIWRVAWTLYCRNAFVVEIWLFRFQNKFRH